MKRTPLPAWLAAVVPAALAGAAVARWVQAPPYDDPYITFRYAANLRDGRGLVFNPGEPVLSTTTPLFALLLGALGALLPSVDLATLGYWLSLVALIAAGIFASAICWREGERAAALLAPFAVMLSPSLVQSVGQETSLLLATGFAGLSFWRQRRLVLAALALGALALTRPDGILLGAILLAAEAQQYRKLPVRAVSLFVLTVAPWYLYAWVTYGSPLPFSLAAKTAQAQTGWWMATGPALVGWLRWAAGLNPLAAVLGLVGVVYAAGRARWVLLLLAWPVAQLAGYTFLGVAFYHWYAAPLHAVLGLFAALGVGTIVRLVWRLARRWWQRSQPVAAMVYLLAALTLVVPSAQYTQSYGRDVPDAKMRQYEEIGSWLRERTDPHSLVGALEVGRLGYFSQRPMFDFVGLVKPAVVPHLREKDLVWSIKSYRPDYLVAIPSDRWLREDDWFRATYAPLRRFVDPRLHEGQPTTVFVRTVGDPPVQHPVRTLTHRFDDRIELVAYGLEVLATERDDTIVLALRWRALQPIDRDLTVSVHALDAMGRLVGQADGQPLAGQWPTSRWRPGETILDPREISMPSSAVVTHLSVGWYLLETMQRLPGVDASGRPAESALIDLGPGR
ncbi:MAG: hypothetical protein HYY04_15005 [Chloroflexi bacterium]|nr:hypothetical protein [Chloroflexota bacterium]